MYNLTVRQAHCQRASLCWVCSRVDRWRCVGRCKRRCDLQAIWQHLVAASWNNYKHITLPRRATCIKWVNDISACVRTCI